MPYISYPRREALNCGEPPETPGELNYLVHTICLDYVEQAPVTSYAVYNDVLGVLEAVKQEFYRRIVVPYEEEKIEENGDVYT